MPEVVIPERPGEVARATVCRHMAPKRFRRTGRPSPYVTSKPSGPTQGNSVHVQRAPPARRRRGARHASKLAGSRSSRAQRRTWRSELADWRSNHATAAPAVTDLSAPGLTRMDDEERRLDERLSGLWAQREGHQRWVEEHPEATVASVASPPKSTLWMVVWLTAARPMTVLGSSSSGESSSIVASGSTCRGGEGHQPRREFTNVTYRHQGGARERSPGRCWDAGYRRP